MHTYIHIYIFNLHIVHPVEGPCRVPDGQPLYLYMYTYIHIYTYVYTHIYTFIYICIYIHVYMYIVYTDGSYTKGTRAHTHRELIREWLWEPKGTPLGYI